MTVVSAVLCMGLYLLSAQPVEDDESTWSLHDMMVDLQWRIETSRRLAWILEKSVRPSEPLMRMVLQEAVGEPYSGMVAVAGVALDRARHPDWPSTVEGVLLQPAQFEGMTSTAVPASADDRAKVQAATEDAMDGERPCGTAYWFHATSMPRPPRWASRLRRLCTVGGHAFYGFRETVR